MTINDGIVIVDTPDAIQAYRYLSMYHMLKLEVNNPGMKHSRGSVMNVIRKEFGITYRTKKRVLEELTKILIEKGILSENP